MLQLLVLILESEICILKEADIREWRVVKENRGGRVCKCGPHTLRVFPELLGMFRDEHSIRVALKD